MKILQSDWWITGASWGENRYSQFYSKVRSSRSRAIKQVSQRSSSWRVVLNSTGSEPGEAFDGNQGVG